jgi:hypothetical protein
MWRYTRVCICVSALLLAGCGVSLPSKEQPAPRRDINAVLAAHDKRLMASPGVVGVYVGVLEDGTTPCLKIMLRQADPKLEQSLPRTIEGYRVVTEITGEIKPMRSR